MEGVLMNELTIKKHFCDQCDDYCDIELKVREATYTFKDKPIEINEKYASCLKCGADVYDENTGNDTLKRLSVKYHELKSGMTIEDYKRIRRDYNLPQTLFAKVLNWGISTVKRYETGTSLPDSSHIAIYKILNTNPASIYNFYQENKAEFTIEERQEVEEKLKMYLFADQKETKIYELLKELYGSEEQTIYNGNSNFNPTKLFNMVLYFSAMGVLKTKLMKLLFYSDFLMYKGKRVSISGISYVRFQYGPVPKNHELMLGAMESINAIKIVEEEGDNGYTKITIQSQGDINNSIFNQQEWDVLLYVNQYFKDFGSKQIADFSHKEEAWLETKENKDISYYFAESLRI